VAEKEVRGLLCRALLLRSAGRLPKSKRQIKFTVAKTESQIIRLSIQRRAAILPFGLHGHDGCAHDRAHDPSSQRALPRVDFRAQQPL